MLLGRRSHSSGPPAMVRGTAAHPGLARRACSGRPFTDCPTLFVANHVSYLDILALGGVARRDLHRQGRGRGAGRCSACWRGSPAPCSSAATGAQALIQRNALAARMRAGESFVLFAEGHQQQRAGRAAAQDQPAQRRRAVDPGLPGRGAGGDPGLCPARRRHAGRSRPIAISTPGTADAELLPHLWDVLQMDGRRAAHGRCTSRCCPGRCRAARCWVASCVSRSARQLALAHAAAAPSSRQSYRSRRRRP